MELHGSHAAKSLLVSLGVVEMYVLLNRGAQLLLVGKFSQIVHLGFQDSPESFHWSIVNASSNSGHALYHFCGRQLCSKALARVLESTVTMEQRMYIGVLLNRFVKGVEHQFIIIAGSNFICHNPSVIEVKDCTEVQLVYLLAIIPLEFRHIGQPLLVRLVRMEIAVQNVLCGDFRDGWCVAVTLFAAYRL